MAQATITSKGQITIPKEIRDSLHLGMGDRIDFLLTSDGEVIMRPVAHAAREVFGLLANRASKPKSLEQIDQKLRDSFKRNSS